MKKARVCKAPSAVSTTCRPLAAMRPCYPHEAATGTMVKSGRICTVTPGRLVISYPVMHGSISTRSSPFATARWRCSMPIVICSAKKN